MARHSHSHAHSHSHDDAPEDGPEFYLPNEDNVLGAAIFFAYIAAALLFTGLIVQDIRRLGRVSAISEADAKTPNSGVRAIRRTFLVVMSFVSFSTLSYHMLRVLIQSYNSWAITHGNVDPSILYQGIFPFNLLDYLSAYRRSVQHWSTTSTLFTNFATSILATPFRRIWTRLVLFYSLTVTIYLSDTAATQSLPHLPWYFILSQILPISFTQHLFLLALSYQQLPSSTATSSTPSRTLPNLVSYLALTLLTTYLLENTLTPNLLASPNLITYVLFVRLLLFLPLIIPNLNRRLFPSHQQPWATSPITRLLATGLLGWQLRTFITLNGIPDGWAKLRGALDEDPAIAALGYDLVLAVVGILGCAILGLLEASEEVVEVVQEEGEAKAEGEELLERVQGKLKGAQERLRENELGSSGVDVGGKQDGELQERLDRGLRARAEG